MDTSSYRQRSLMESTTPPHLCDSAPCTDGVYCRGSEYWEGTPPEGEKLHLESLRECPYSEQVLQKRRGTQQKARTDARIQEQYSLFTG